MLTVAVIVAVIVVCVGAMVGHWWIWRHVGAEQQQRQAATRMRARVAQSVIEGRVRAVRPGKKRGKARLA